MGWLAELFITVFVEYLILGFFAFFYKELGLLLLYILNAGKLSRADLRAKYIKDGNTAFVVIANILAGLTFVFLVYKLFIYLLSWPARICLL